MRFVVLLFLLAGSTFAQGTMENYKIFDSTGNLKTLQEVIESFKSVDVVFIGEQHDDSIAHQLQLEILRLAFERYSSTRKLALSLEMFERDVQIVLDEYLQDLITEKQFLASSRPWNNYKSDYRPLVEFAKSNKIPVIAANAPRRYVNMVSRLGRDSLSKLSDQAKKWIAPLPYAEASEKYAQKFKEIMGSEQSGQHNLLNLLDSQSLWDATMAFSLSEFLKKEKMPMIIHLNGSFHSEERLGVPEHLIRYAPSTKFLVLTIKKEKESFEFQKTKHEKLGDFVILTK